MKVSVLHSQNNSPNEICFLYPLLKFRKYLAYNNINLNFTHNLQGIEADIILLSSKWFSSLWSSKGPEYIFKILQDLKSKSSKLIWYDISDSTGTTHFMVLPFVDGYLKNQIFKDKNNYLNKYYGSRIYCDFMHRNFQVEDSNPGEPHLNYIPAFDDLAKVRCGWNSGLAYFGSKRHWQSYLFSKYKGSYKYFRNKWVSPLSNRDLKVSCRIGTNYSRNTISASRRMIIEKLTDNLPMNKLSYKQYLNELRHSVSAISPFGLGEISLRDFEIVLNGAAVIKQDMSHLETWPNLWLNNQTYLDIKWDFSDLEQKLEFAKDDVEQMKQYAITSQQIYKQALGSKDSPAIFCRRLVGSL
jgi:hypothetical protein